VVTSALLLALDSAGGLEAFKVGWKGVRVGGEEEKN
jgi:hypothetical protein